MKRKLTMVTYSIILKLEYINETSCKKYSYKTTHIWVVCWLFLVVWGLSFVGGWVTCFLALLRGNASSLRSFLPLQMDLSSSFFIHSRRWFITHLSNFSLIFSKQKKQCVSVWHPSTKTCNYFHHNGWKLCEGFESSRVFDFYLNLLFLLWGLNQMLLLFSSLSVGGEQAIGEGSLFQKLKKINLIMSCVIPL